MPFSVAWIKAELPRYLALAIDEPSPENIRAYYYLQRVMMDKAERFATTAQTVVMGDPVLDESNRYPTASFGAQRQKWENAKARNELVSRLAETTGLFFFFGGDCPACGQQAYVLKELEKTRGIKTKAVSVDGTEIDERFFTEVLADTGQAASLGVTRTPAIVVINPERGIVHPIAQGHLLSADDIQDRMLIVAKQSGIVSPDELDRASAVKGAADQLLVDGAGVSDDILSDPQHLVDYLQGEIR